MIRDTPDGEFEELEPQIIKEVWNSYQLDDGSRIHARIVLMKVLWPKGVRPKQGEAVQVQGRLSPLVTIFSPAKLRGNPNPNPPSAAILPNFKTQESEIVDSNEDWNVYRLPGKLGGLKTKMVVSSIYRVMGVFDQYGDPFYIVNSTTVLGPTSPREVATP